MDKVHIIFCNACMNVLSKILQDARSCVDSASNPGLMRSDGIWKEEFVLNFFMFVIVSKAKNRCCEVQVMLMGQQVLKSDGLIVGSSPHEFFIAQNLRILLEHSNLVRIRPLSPLRLS